MHSYMCDLTFRTFVFNIRTYFTLLCLRPVIRFVETQNFQVLSSASQHWTRSSRESVIGRVASRHRPR